MDKLKQIKVIGNLLSTYESDLKYISSFSKLENNDRSFKIVDRFISDYRVARNIKVSQRMKFFEITLNYKKSKNNDVDKFASILQNNGVTSNGCFPVSLASKILFTIYPDIVYPLDSLAKKALNLKQQCSYEKYLSYLIEYINVNDFIIRDTINKAQPFLETIEKSYNITNSSKIRYTRVVDKMLWTIGKDNI